MRHEVRAAFSAQSWSGYRQGQSSVIRRSRKKGHAERSLWNDCCHPAAGAKPHALSNALNTVLQQSLLWRSTRAVCGKRMPVRYRFICDAQSIFDLKMLPESSEARFRRYSPFLRCRRNSLAAHSSGFRRETCGPEHGVLAGRYFQ